MDKPQIIEQPAEKRQIAKVLVFPPELAPFIDWESVARQARELGSHFEVRFAAAGTCTVTLFWSYTDDDLPAKTEEHAPVGLDWSIPPFAESHLLTEYVSPWSFEETVARLVTASGQPAKSSDDYKTSVQFEGTFNGQGFTLYDYKESRDIHVGGADSLDLEGLISALTTVLAAVKPTPYLAKEYYDGRVGHSWSVASPVNGDRH